jgi:S-adenosylmethionine:tRNA ribosyltransferase-isomerase
MRVRHAAVQEPRTLQSPALSAPANLTPCPVLTLSDFDYPLPEELIAQTPPAERSAGRLLVVGHDALTDSTIRDLPRWLVPGDLLVFNDTRVHARPALRQQGQRRPRRGADRASDRRHEALAQVRASKTPRPAAACAWKKPSISRCSAATGEFFRLRSLGDDDLVDLLERHGRLPLPPYIERAAADADEQRYQTVFARKPVRSPRRPPACTSTTNCWPR